MKESRAPINLRIKFRSESIDQFIDRYSIDVSRGGIFIRTREPLAVGTQLKFDFQLQDASPLMGGEGTVVWIREYDANRTGITPGMGVRFDKLTPASQPVLEKILAEKGRRDQSSAPSGGIMSKVGAGIAVRRPSSTFTALDPRALGLVPNGPGAEATNARTPAPDTARRERGPSSPVASDPSEKTQPGHQPSAFSLSPALAAPERTNQGGFQSPSAAGGTPAPMTLPSSAGAHRGRTPPGPLPALSTPGSGRDGTNAEVPSLVSRLSAARPSYEPPSPADIDKALDGLTGRGSPPPTTGGGASKGQIGDGVPVLDHDVPSNATSTGDAPTDAFTAGLTRKVQNPGAAAAADGAAPVAEVDGDDERTVATSAAEVAAIVGADAVAGELESTSRDLVAPALANLAGARAPAAAAASLFLVKTEPGAAPAKAGAGAAPGSAEPAGAAKHPAEEAASRVSSAVPKDELVPDQKTPQPTVVASSAQSTTAAGSFTAAAPPPAAAGSRAPRTQSARSPKKKSAAAFIVVGGLVAAGAVIALVASRPSTSEHAQETSAAPKNEAVSPPTPQTGESAAAAGPAAPAAAEAVGSPKPAEATPPAATAAAAAAIPAPAPAAAPVAEAPAAPAVNPAEAQAADEHPAAAKPAAEHKTVVVVGPPKRSSAAAARGASADGAEPPPAAAAKLAVQHLLKITSSPAGAQVLIDGQSVGSTPYTAKEINADAPHAVSVRLDGYEPHEHMIGASDWTKQKGNVETAKVSVKLRKLAPVAPAEPPPAKSESAAAEPAKGETKTEASPAPALPAEKTAAEAPAAPSTIEPPAQKDEPTTAAPPAK